MLVLAGSDSVLVLALYSTIYCAVNTPAAPKWPNRQVRDSGSNLCITHSRSSTACRAAALALSEHPLAISSAIGVHLGATPGHDEVLVLYTDGNVCETLSKTLIQ